MENPGLSSKIAAHLLITHGPNELVHTKRVSNVSMFLGQLNSPLVIILLIATIFSLLLGDVVESVLIVLIVLANAVLGFIQENKAEHALAALTKMTVTLTRVMRDGKIIEIDNRQLVPGDVIYLEEGNKIPADATILEAIHFEVNESALTGESMPVEKDAKHHDHRSVYMGTIVARGRATAQITQTAMNTRFGQIAKNLADIKKEETPLEKKLRIVAKQIGIIALLAAVVIFVIGVYNDHSFIEMLLTGISLGVAAVPEGLPAVITITLALGMQRMAAKRAILRKLSAIEAVGSITIIATDKTGTLTKNQMRVTKFWIPNTTYAQSDAVKPTHKKIIELLMKTGVYCNNASLSPSDTSDLYEVIGDQTEGALLMLAAHRKWDVRKMKSLATLVDEHAFDAVTKTMSVVMKDNDGMYVYTKGAPESILSRASHIATPKGQSKLTAEDRDMIISEYEAFAKLGLRTIALAVKKVTKKPINRAAAESSLVFIGFAGIADPPREEIPEAIRISRSAGITTIMITGDNELTAYAIGKHIGLVKTGDEVITGAQMTSLDDIELKNKLQRTRVFARVTPEQKLRIVRALQSMGHIVAVTGDGVNDALALKQADVGVAMGKTGTDVAKEAADMIITDDNYASLVTAVEEGRGIYDNMKASIKYLIGCNVGEIISILGGALLGWPLILTPIQILYMNLATDGLQAIALAVNPKSSNIMKRKPHGQGDLFRTKDRIWLMEVSFITAIITLIAFQIGYRTGGIILGQSIAFTIIVICQQWIYLDIASIDQSAFTGKLWKNPWMTLPIVIFISQIAFLHIPITQKLFSLSAPSIQTLGLAIMFTFAIIALSELRKRAGRHIFY